MELLALGALAVLGLVAVAGGIAAVAGRVARQRDRANQVVSGVPSGAPAAWAGAHTPEARLHRRLRAAVDAAAVAAPGADGPLVGLRRAVEEEALAVDERLVTAAAAPQGRRAELLARVASQVEGVEEAAGALAEQAVDAPGRARAVDDALERVRLLAEARAEVDELDRRERGEVEGPGRRERGEVDRTGADRSDVREDRGEGGTAG